MAPFRHGPAVIRTTRSRAGPAASACQRAAAPPAGRQQPAAAAAAAARERPKVTSSECESESEFKLPMVYLHLPAPILDSQSRLGGTDSRECRGEHVASESHGIRANKHAQKPLDSEMKSLKEHCVTRTCTCLH